jgi:hypothetical protein
MTRNRGAVVAVLIIAQVAVAQAIRGGTTPVATAQVIEADTCTYAISPTMADASGAGGSGSFSVAVTSGTSCSWTAAANVPWLHVTAGAGGTGNGTVGYSVDANPGLARVGAITAAGLSFAVNQAETSGALVVASDDFESAFPGAWHVGHAAGAAATEWGRVTCNAAAGTGSAWCAAGGASPQPVCTQYVDSMSTQMVYGPFSLADALTAWAEFDLSYDTESCCDFVSFGVSVDGTTYSWSDYAGNSGGWVHQSVDLAGISGVTPVGAPQVWVAFRFTSDIGRAGAGAFVDNLVVRKTTPNGCAYTLSSTSADVPAAGGSGSVSATVATGNGCAWTAIANAAWIHLTSASSGSGNGTVSFAVDANSGLARTGTIAFAGQLFTIDQARSTSGIVVVSDDFEGPFPGAWQVDHATGASGTEWGKVTCNAAAGTGSAWCAAGGGSPQPACSVYTNSMSTRMTYGPFSLADAIAAWAEFDVSYDTEACCDFVSYGLSTDGTNFAWADLSGSSGGWVHETVDFAGIGGLTLVGAPQAWIAFRFTSDVGGLGGGAYIDNLVVNKATPCGFTITAQPQGTTISSGETATLSVSVTGTAPLSYQWYRGSTGDTSAPVGTNAASFTTPALTATTSYWVRVSNACGHVDSTSATVTVRPWYTASAWVAVASHAAGLNSSQWRSDLGLLNTGSATARVEVDYYGGTGVVTKTTYVPAGAQSILTDVVGQLGGSGSGAVEVLSDQPLKITERTYNQVSATAACYPSGTQGQDYPAVTGSDGLAASQSAYLAGLTENAAYHTNIGLVNTGATPASVLVELFDGAGTKLTDYTVPLTVGLWAQETQPFRKKAGQTAMDRGYARLTVQTGSGVFGFGSVISNVTNDPTTVSMLR